MNIDGHEYMTTAEAAAHLGVTQGRIRQIKQSGFFTTTRKVGNATLIAKSEVEAYRLKRDAGVQSPTDEG